MSDMDLYSYYEAFEEHADEYYDEGVDLDDLFDPEFMEEHTQFNDIMAFMKAAPPDVEEAADLKGLTYDDFDPFVEEHTQFDGFAEMFASAVRRWTHEHAGE